MDIGVNSIVTLEDNCKYILVDDVDKDYKKYFLANMIDDNMDLLDDSKIFEKMEDNGNYYLEEVTDELLLNELTEKFIFKIKVELDDDMEMIL